MGFRDDNQLLSLCIRKAEKINEKRLIFKIQTPMIDASVPGGVPEWPKGSDCKSDGSAFAGSNPAPSRFAHAGVVQW